MHNESPSSFSGLQSVISSITFLFSLLSPSYFLISFPTTVHHAHSIPTTLASLLLFKYTRHAIVLVPFQWQFPLPRMFFTPCQHGPLLTAFSSLCSNGTFSMNPILTFLINIVVPIVVLSWFYSIYYLLTYPIYYHKWLIQFNYWCCLFFIVLYSLLECKTCSEWQILIDWTVPRP